MNLFRYFAGNKKFITIDIGTHAIKTALFASKGEDLKLLAAEMYQLTPETIDNGLIKEPSVIASRLKEIFKKVNFKPGKIVMTVPGDNLIIRTIELPEMAEEELNEALKWEAEEYLPFPVDEAVIEYHIISETEDTLKILLVAVKQQVMENYLEPFNRLDITPSVVNIQPMALISILEFQDEIEESLAIIDIGAANTRVVIGNDNVIYLSRSIDIGGEEFTRLLMEEKQMDFQVAEKHKKDYELVEELNNEEDYSLDLAIPEVAATGNESNSMMLSIARNLAQEISRSINYYSMKFRGKTIDKIYITGGGSKLGNLKNIISNELDREIEVLNPFKHIDVQNIDHFSKEELSVVVGLGLSEVLYSEG